MKLTDILKDSGMELGKVYTDKDIPPFQVNEYGTKTSDLVGTPKKEFGKLYPPLKTQMEARGFDPKNPSLHILGFGVYDLKSLEKAIARDLKDCISRDAEYTAQKLYMKHSTTEAKIKAANDIYKIMETSQYKRAVTMWKKKR
tara:strand:- start:20 stop:448 length:429 start_codon:yes stop_codon:yes gene_type:complete